ncbi:MAG: murein transglycosylase [Rhodobacterales bacterium]|nr:MAG: murein transglycosylase [Rhodobacterales bacterium]
MRAELFDRVMEGLPFLPGVLQKQAGQKEFTRSLRDYLAIAASDERIRNGQKMLCQHSALFDRIERDFAVERQVVCAIWGLETGYGAIMGDTGVLPALATLAHAGRRAEYFESELIAALRLLQLGLCRPEQMHGSWAGAMGHGQFMPSALLAFGVDVDGDGACTIGGTDPADALASVANYLAQNGWQRALPWGVEVVLPEGFDHTRAGPDQSLTQQEWADLGVTAASGKPLPEGPGSVLLPAGANGPALLVSDNFHVILRYNRATAYAIGIGHLADRLAGGGPFVAGWPEDRALASGEIREAQRLLSRAGFGTFGADGMIGPNTIRAVRGFQAEQGLVADGYLGPVLLKALRATVGDPAR